MFRPTAIVVLVVVLLTTLSAASPADAQQTQSTTDERCEPYQEFIASDACRWPRPSCSANYNQLIYNEWIVDGRCTPCTYNERIVRDSCWLYLEVTVDRLDDGPELAERVQLSTLGEANAVDGFLMRDAVTSTEQRLASDSVPSLAITGVQQQTPIAGLVLLGLGSFALATERIHRKREAR